MAATLICLHCGGDFGDGDRFCARCGSEALACPRCEHQLAPGDLSCPHCGTPAERSTLPEPSTTQADGPAVLTEMIERLRRATLGEFEIGRELGRGGMAAVFLAHEISLDRKVAIKVMSPGLMLGEGMVDRFKHEAITIAGLHHPNIVSVYSVRQAEGLHCFVMRYVRGRSLEQVVQLAGRLPLAIVRSILHQVGSALTYAHRARVIHRDIKPANILIDEDGNAVVTDFGIAKAAERPSQTLTGALVGTPAYMSPEQCSGAEVTGASDQYALGAVAYELLTGAPPFAGSTLTIMQSHVERAPRPIQELFAECPPEVEAAILRMLEKDPAARWPRLADAMAALGAAPLAEDDPLRAELIGYASPDAASTLSGATTPTSPAPRTRASPPGGGPVRPVGGISIMPAPAGLETGDSFALVAVIRGQHGTRMPPRAVDWSTDAPAVLRIDGASGIASAVGAGSAVVTATCKGITALLRVEVAPPRADDIVIEPMNEALHVGEQIRLDATPQDKRGWPVPRAVTWQSADPAVAAITGDGAIAGWAPGTVRITAALDDARASIVIPVLPPRVAIVDIADPPVSVVAGQTFMLTARTLDLMNAPLPGRALLWSTSDVSVAVVTAEGLVAALQPGSVVLTATCEGVRASVRIGVVAATPAATPHTEVRYAPRRRSRRAKRQAFFAGGATLVAGVLWLLLRPAPVPGPADSGQPDAGGGTGFVAGAVGADTSPSSSVVITQRPARALRPAGAFNLIAEVRDTAGRAMEDAALVWTSSDSAVVQVDRITGRAVAVRPGQVHIVAANGRGRDSVMIAVRRAGARVPAAASIGIAAFPPLPAGQSTLLGAVVLGPAGDTLTGVEVTWTSSNPQVATIEALSGLARGHAPGTTLILARSGNQTAAAELRVFAGAVAALDVLGARPMAVSETLALRVSGRDREGMQLGDFPVVWTSGNERIATVDEATGAVVGRAPGSVRIVAAAGAESASTQVTVLPRPQRLQAQNPNSERLQAETWVAAGVEQCYGALQSRNLARLGLLWRPVSRSDEENLKRLTRILQTPDLEAVVGERTDRPPTIGPQAATAEFTAPLTWRESSGGSRTSHLVFRAGLVRTLDRWELSSCRVVGSPRL